MSQAELSCADRPDAVNAAVKSFSNRASFSPHDRPGKVRESGTGTFICTVSKQFIQFALWQNGWNREDFWQGTQTCLWDCSHLVFSYKLSRETQFTEKRLFSNSRARVARRSRLAGCSTILDKIWSAVGLPLDDFVTLALAEANWLSMLTSETSLIRARLCTTRARPCSTTRSLRCKSNTSIDMPQLHPNFPKKFSAKSYDRSFIS